MSMIANEDPLDLTVDTEDDVRNDAPFNLVMPKLSNPIKSSTATAVNLCLVKTKYDQTSSASHMQSAHHGQTSHFAKKLAEISVAVVPASPPQQVRLNNSGENITASHSKPGSPMEPSKAIECQEVNLTKISFISSNFQRLSDTWSTKNKAHNHDCTHHLLGNSRLTIRNRLRSSKSHTVMHLRSLKRNPMKLQRILLCKPQNMSKLLLMILFHPKEINVNIHQIPIRIPTTVIVNQK